MTLTEQARAICARADRLKNAGMMAQAAQAPEMVEAMADLLFTMAARLDALSRVVIDVTMEIETDIDLPEAAFPSDEFRPYIDEVA